MNLGLGLDRGLALTAPRSVSSGGGGGGDVPTPPEGFDLLKGADDAYLQGADSAYLYGATP